MLQSFEPSLYIHLDVVMYVKVTQKENNLSDFSTIRIISKAVYINTFNTNLLSLVNTHLMQNVLLSFAWLTSEVGRAYYWQVVLIFTPSHKVFNACSSVHTLTTATERMTSYAQHIQIHGMTSRLGSATSIMERFDGTEFIVTTCFGAAEFRLAHPRRRQVVKLIMLVGIETTNHSNGNGLEVKRNYSTTTRYVSVSTDILVTWLSWEIRICDMHSFTSDNCSVI